MRRDGRPLVIGIGSPILGDDGIGVHAARAVKEDARTRHVDVIELGTAGIALLDFIAGHDCLIIIDAVYSGAEPGTLHDLNADEIACCAHLDSGHDADLPAVLALGNELKGADMPESVLVLGVEAEELTRFSEELTPRVAAAIPRVVTRIATFLASR